MDARCFTVGPVAENAWIARRDGETAALMIDPGDEPERLTQAVEAVGRVPGLSRQACRAAFERQFDASRMARDYLEVYRRLAHHSPEGAARSGPGERTAFARAAARLARGPGG